MISPASPLYSASSPKPMTKRKRGFVLSESGFQRLNQAIRAIEIAENGSKRFTAEELSKRTGISTSTFRRIWSSKSGIDRRILILVFNAFNLNLLDHDLQHFINKADVISSQPVEDNFDKNYPITYPDGPVPIDSPRYICRSGIDALAFQEIAQPGCVIRIKAPSGFGKKSLVLRLIDHISKLKYSTAVIDLQQVDSEILVDPHTFLQWFCIVLSRKLRIDIKIDQYWDDVLGSKLSTTLYLQEVILGHLKSPLVLVLKNIEYLFEYPSTAKVLLPLLRSWHHESKHDNLWKCFRLVVTYSTDYYLPLDINQSPFNIGLPLLLPEFTAEEVQTLATSYLIELNQSDCDRLLNLTNAHPSLIGLALYHLSQGMELEHLLQSAYTLEGIYRNHLQQLLSQVHSDSQWREKLRLLMQDQTGGSKEQLDPIDAYKLEGIGLIKCMSGTWQFRCQLYQTFFANI